MFKNLQIGDTVNIECLTSHGQDSTDKITEIATKFDDYTGLPYLTLYVGEWQFDARNGLSINAPTMYTLT